jgi:proteic killer suppression protein
MRVDLERIEMTRANPCTCAGHGRRQRRSSMRNRRAQVSFLDLSQAIVKLGVRDDIPMPPRTSEYTGDFWRVNFGTDASMVFWSPRSLTLTSNTTSCIVTRYTYSVIKSFRHDGVKRFFQTGSKAATHPSQMNLPGWKWHALSSDLAGHWAISVSANWRLTFSFEGEDAILVDYHDYH